MGGGGRRGVTGPASSPKRTLDGSKLLEKSRWETVGRRLPSSLPRITLWVGSRLPFPSIRTPTPVKALQNQNKKNLARYNTSQVRHFFLYIVTKGYFMSLMD